MRVISDHGCISFCMACSSYSTMPFVRLGHCCVNSDDISYFYPLCQNVGAQTTVIFFKHSGRDQITVQEAFRVIERKLSAT